MMTPMLYDRPDVSAAWPHPIGNQVIADLPTNWDGLTFSYRYHGGFDKATLRLVRDRRRRGGGSWII